MSQSPLSSHPGLYQARGPFAAAVRAYAAQHPAHVHTYQVLEHRGLAVALVEYSTTHPDYEGGLRVEAFRYRRLPPQDCGWGVECIEFMNAGGLEELVPSSTYYLKVGEVDARPYWSASAGMHGTIFSVNPPAGGPAGSQARVDFIEETIMNGDIDLGAYLLAASTEVFEVARLAEEL